MFLPIFDSNIDEFGILRFLRRRQNQRGVGGGVLGFVFSDGLEVTGVTHDRGARGFELIERGRHDGL